jgi:hypothetical protein
VVPDGRRLRFFIRLAAPKSDELYADRRTLIFIRRGAALPRHARFFSDGRSGSKVVSMAD